MYTTQQYVNKYVLYIIEFKPNIDGLQETIDTTKKYYIFGQSSQLQSRLNLLNNYKYNDLVVIKCYEYPNIMSMNRGRKILSSIIQDHKLNVNYYNSPLYFKASNLELNDIYKKMQ